MVVMETDIKLKYSVLSTSMKTEAQRDSVTSSDVTSVKDVIKGIQSEEDLVDNLDVIYNAFRYLRNMCVQCKKNQDFILDTRLLNETSFLFNVIFAPKIVTAAASACADDDDGLLPKVRVMCVQFLGNLIVKNKLAVETVWELCFPKLFFSMMSNLDAKTKDFVCMVIYNCLHGGFDLTNSKDECWLLASIIEHCNDFQDAEWGLLVMELVVSTANFTILYEELADYPAKKLSLLDILDAFLTDEGPKATHIPEVNLLFICKQFETKSSCLALLSNYDGGKEEEEEVLEECQLIFKLMSVVGTATSYAEQYSVLRQNEDLLMTAINLLKQVTATSEPVVSGKDTSGENEHPLFGVKRNLVKIIGNLCYGSRLMQDKTREYEGIVPVLNCCVLDERNPFLMQWGVFAVRTLCEGNEENQEFVRTLQNQGVASELLADTNIQAKLENGKIKICNIEEELCFL